MASHDISKRYFAYENWRDQGRETSHRVNVHLERCFDNRRKGASKKHGKWHRLGRFDTPESAMKEAKNKNRIPGDDVTFWFCGNCLREWT